MSYLNSPYSNNFQELCACYPVWYLDVFEMRQILKTEGKLLDGICDGIEAVVCDNFILTADETTIHDWEQVLEIRHYTPITLEQRRAVIISHFCGFGHIGEPEIRAIIGAYTNAPISVDFAKGILTIVIEGDIFDEGALLDILLKRIPAHIAVDISVKENRLFRHDVVISTGTFSNTRIKSKLIKQGE